VVVVVSAGNYGARTTRGDSANTSAVMGSITEPAHAEDCIAVGSTHRDGFTPGTFFRVDATRVVNNVNDQAFAGAHSDIRKPAVAELAVGAAAAHG